MKRGVLVNWFGVITCQAGGFRLVLREWENRETIPGLRALSWGLHETWGRDHPVLGEGACTKKNSPNRSS